MFEIPGENDAIRKIQRDLTSLWKHAEAAWELSLKLVPDGIHVPGNGEIIRFTVGCHAKQIRLARASFLQIECGLALESMLAVRAMFELLIHLTYFDSASDKAKTAEKFVLWQLMNNEKMLRLGAGAEASTDEWKNTLARYVAQIEKKKKQFNDISNWKDFVKYGPSLESIEKLSIHQNEGNAYNQIYRYGSQIMHSSDSYHYATPTHDGKIQLRLSPNGDWTGPALVAVISIQCKTLQIIDRVLSLGRSKEILKLFQVPIPPSEVK